jgi:hypothetical protein
MVFQNCKDFSVKIASQLVAKFGVVVYDQYFNDQDLSLLNKEFDQAFDPGQRGIDKINLEIGRGVILNKNLIDQNKFFNIIRVFSLPFMDEMSKEYWKANVDLNKQIYLMNEKIGTQHVAMDMHFDVLPTLKFFVYLTDTSRENGAFACVPGSQEIAADIRKKMGLNISHDQREITRKIPFNENEVVHVEGKAGTLIIFTTEVFHRAGKVSIGERRVMRGHNRP